MPMTLMAPIAKFAARRRGSPDKTEGKDEQDLYALGVIRDIRVHSQDAQRSLTEIKSALANRDGEARAKHVKEVLAKRQETFERNKKNVQDLHARMRTLFDVRHDLYNDYGDEVSQVADLWERVVQEWPTEQQTLDEVTRKIPEIENCLQEIIWHCGFVTIPPRVNEHLVGIRVGQAMDFHKNFTDELPEKKDRDEILKYLKDHPLDIEGVTDVQDGVIYRAAHNPRARLASFGRIAGLLLLGVPLVWIACHAGDWLDLSGWPVRGDQLHSFFIAYIFVLLGGFLHVLIAAFKQARSGKEHAFTALEDFVLWVHVKELPIMGGILSLSGSVFLDWPFLASCPSGKQHFSWVMGSIV
jgi:hypothetical protein